jgi:hypothetical protein
VFVGFASLTAWILQDRQTQRDKVTALTSEAQAAIDDGQYERAMRIALLGLPVPGQLPWALQWSEPAMRSLEAKLADAAQLSAMIHKFEEREGKDQANLPYAAFNPDGTNIVTAAENGRATIWEVRTGKRIAECSEAEISADKKQSAGLEWMWSSQFSPDGSRVVSSNHDGVAMIWTVAGDKCNGYLLLPPIVGPLEALHSAATSAGNM